MRNNSPTSTPESRYARELTQLPRQIVFIMGCHRSGTSMLYHLLAYTGEFEYLSAYDIIKHDEIVTNRIEGREQFVKAELDRAIRVEKNRGVDNLPVGADYPEEYRFLLAPKVPRWFVSMRKRVERLSFAPHLTQETRERLLEICRKKRFLASRDRPLILKNPNDFYFNFEAVHRMFPEAKMVFIHRHPLDILNSYVAGFGAITDSKNAYAALLDAGYRNLFRSPLQRRLSQQAFRGVQLPRYVMRSLVQSFEYYLDKIRFIPRDKCMSLRYEDLCEDPEYYLTAISRWLEVHTTPRVTTGFIARRNLKLGDTVRAAYLERAQEIGSYLTSQNYSPYPDSISSAAMSTK